MPDMQTDFPRSATFIDDGDGCGRFSFALHDGSCRYVAVTATMAALFLSQLSDFVTKEYARVAK